MKNLLVCLLKYPEPGFVKTRLAADLGGNGAAELYRALAERVITEVYPLEADYDLQLCVDPAFPMGQYKDWVGDSWRFTRQQGADLGERMHHAVETAETEGYERIVVIGSDCIGMDQAFLKEVFSHLDREDIVIGPSDDGGYYLLGCKQSHDWMFERMPWSTDGVLAETLKRIEDRGLVVKQLQVKIDVDTIDDLTRFRDQLPEEHFLVKKIDQIVRERLSGSVGDVEFKTND